MEIFEGPLFCSQEITTLVKSPSITTESPGKGLKELLKTISPNHWGHYLHRGNMNGAPQSCVNSAELPEIEAVT